MGELPAVTAKALRGAVRPDPVSRASSKKRVQALWEQEPLLKFGGGGADRGRYLVFPASGRQISSGQAAGRDVVQEATIPLPTCLFSTEKAPESHFPSKSTVSIPTPVRGGVASVVALATFEAGLVLKEVIADTR